MPPLDRNGDPIPFPVASFEGVEVACPDSLLRMTTDSAHARDAARSSRLLVGT